MSNIAQEKNTSTDAVRDEHGVGDERSTPAGEGTGGRRRRRTNEAARKKVRRTIRCPRCGRKNEVYFSRLGNKKNIFKKLVFHYYICDVCEYRFREFKPALAFLAFLLLMSLVGVTSFLIWLNVA